MARVASSVQDPKLAAALQRALEDGSLSLPKACRVARALQGCSQDDFAARLGVSLKVIRAVESGRGNPRYHSLEKIAAAAGLRVTFMRPKLSVELMDPEARVLDERRRRIASARALAAGEISEREIHERSALRVDDVVFELPELA